MVVWSCPEHAVSVRTMLLLYGEVITIITELFYGRSGSRTLTTQLLLFSPGGYTGVKVKGGVWGGIGRGELVGTMAVNGA